MNPYIGGIEGKTTARIARFPSIWIDLTYIALIHGELYSWLKMLLQFGHSPFEALRSAGDFWAQFLWSDESPWESIGYGYLLEIQTAIEELGWNQDILDIIRGENSIPYEWGTKTSSTDFEPAIVTRLKDLNSVEPTLVQRSARRYEDD